MKIPSNWKIKNQRFSVRSQSTFVSLRDIRVLGGHPYPLRLISGGQQGPFKSPCLCRQGYIMWPLGPCLPSSVLLCVLFSLLSPTEAPCFTSHPQGPGARAAVLIYPRSWEQRSVRKWAFWEASGGIGLLPIELLILLIIIGTSSYLSSLRVGKEIYFNYESTRELERGLHGTRVGGCRGFGDGWQCVSHLGWKQQDTVRGAWQSPVLICFHGCCSYSYCIIIIIILLLN